MLLFGCLSTHATTFVWQSGFFLSIVYVDSLFLKFFINYYRGMDHHVWGGESELDALMGCVVGIMLTFYLLYTFY